MTWRYDNLKKNLNVFIDGHGRFCYRAKDDNSLLPYEKKYPILLPTDSHLTVLVIQDAHKSVWYNGVREPIGSRYSKMNQVKLVEGGL